MCTSTMLPLFQESDNTVASLCLVDGYSNTLLPCIFSSWSSDDSADVLPPVPPLSCCLSERLQIHTSLFLNFIQPSYPWSSSSSPTLSTCCHQLLFQPI